jgi:thioredoxin 1
MTQSVTRFLQEHWPTLAFLAVIAAAWLLLRTSSSGAGSVDEFDRVLGAGEPVVVEFFSNTWPPCLLAKPVVDRIEEQLVGKAKVIRVNLMSQMGLTLARRYNVRASPTVLVFDTQGSVIYSVAGIPDAAAITGAVDELGVG